MPNVVAFAGPASGFAPVAMQNGADGPTAQPRRPRDGAVEGLRGLAAVVVLYNHVMGVPLRDWLPPPWLLWPVDGAAAVMIFFVLSGYVIGLTYHGEATTQSVRAYAWRRFVRLMPINLAGVLLACAVATRVEWGTVLANLFFLQNYTHYAGVWFPVLDTNPNLWSLNYEVVYYLVFILIWVLRPSLKLVGLISVALLLLGWYTRFVPLFLACYAAGFLFWLGGLALAWHTEPAREESTNWPSCLLLVLITWKLHGLRLLLSGLPMPSFAGPVVKLYFLDFWPAAIWLLSAVARRTFPLLSAIRIVALVIPAVGFLCQLSKRGDASPTDLQWQLGAYLLALALWRWRPSLQFFRKFAPVGVISYALYAISHPIQEAVLRHNQALPANAVGFMTFVMTVTLVSFGVAWYLERRIQPALQHLLVRPSSASPTASEKIPG
jgi:peptidoglycan/LPS O-acetylase OafA/YrhL